MILEQLKERVYTLQPSGHGHYSYIIERIRYSSDRKELGGCTLKQAYMALYTC